MCSVVRRLRSRAQGWIGWRGECESRWGGVANCGMAMGGGGRISEREREARRATRALGPVYACMLRSMLRMRHGMREGLMWACTCRTNVSRVGGPRARVRGVLHCSIPASSENF